VTDHFMGKVSCGTQH